MKQSKRLVRWQKECVAAHNLKMSDWRVVKETESYLYLINKETKDRRIVDKFVR